MISDENWRLAYHEMTAEAAEKYRVMRRENPYARISVPGRRTMLDARFLTDRQIDDIAWREAETDVNYARNQERASQARARMRAGEAQ